MAARRPRTSPDRRTEIVDAALRVVLRDGIDGIRSQAVATEAGVSVALPHYYFPTLEDLTIALWERVEAEERARTQSTLKGAGSPLERVRAFAFGSFEGTADDVRERWMLRTEFQRRALFARDIADAVRAAEQRRLDALEVAIAAGQSDGDVPAGVEPGLIAGRIAGALDGFGVMLLVDLVTPGDAIAGLEALLSAPMTWQRPRALAIPALEPQPDEGDVDRRNAILDATIRLIEREGIAGVHFPEVADEAGVSRSLPRYYYPTLGDLLRATFARDEDIARRRVEWRAGQIDDDLERLRDAYAHAIATDPAGLRPTWVLWFEYLRIAARDPLERRRANARLAGWIAYDSGILRGLKRSGRIAKSVDIDAAEQRLLAIDNGAGALWMLGVFTPEHYAAVMDATIDDELGIA
ncbi:MAG: TetR/AcrR family transcriptional regulator [Gaiellales bacterium]